jgi:hypothetical protein
MKKAKPPRRHHTVAVMMLKNFTDENGLLWVYNKSNPHIRQSTPDAVFYENDFHTQINKDGTKDTSLEAFFAGLEGETNHLIQKICGAARAGELPGLSKTERKTWDQFLFYQWKRSPDFLKSAGFERDFEAVLGEVLQDFEKQFRPMTDDERALVQKPSFKKDIKRSARVVALRDPGQTVQPALNQLGLAVGRLLNPNKSFIIGTKPVTKLAPKDRTTLGDPEVEVWLPIASDIVVCMVPNGGSEMLANLDDKSVRELNEVIFRESTTIASRSSALIASLTGARIQS